MHRNFARAAAVAAILAAAIAVGYSLIDARFRTGDILAAYSSDLHEPMGTSALRQTLERSGRTVTIMTRPLQDYRPDPRDSLVMYLVPYVMGESEFDDDERRAIRDFLTAGGRVFIATARTSFLDDYRTRAWSVREAHRDSGPVAVKGIGPFAALLGRDTVPAPGAGRIECRWPEADALMAVDTRPIAYRLRVGDGELIACAEPFLISNEGLLLNRQSPWPAWLASGRARVYIDETRHGVYHDQGVAWLIGKYGLWPFVAMLAFISLLVLWMVLPPLTPLPEPLPPTASRQDTFAGFVNLLSGVVPERMLIDVCLDKWSQGSTAVRGADTRDLLPEGAPPKSVSETYNVILKKLEERKRHVI